MNGISGTYKDGKIVLDEEVDWPDGVAVHVMPGTQDPEQKLDTYFDGSRWDDSPEAVRRWIEWFDSLNPVFSGSELDQFESDLRSARQAQDRLLPDWQQRIDDLAK